MIYNLFMNFRNLKIKNLIGNLLIVLAYPILKGVITKKMIMFCDSCTIIGLALLLVGAVNILVLHGDFDIIGYIARRNDPNRKNYDAYSKDQHEKRKDSFNYPLLEAIILFIISYLFSFFC